MYQEKYIGLNNKHHYQTHTLEYDFLSTSFYFNKKSRNVTKKIHISSYLSTNRDDTQCYTLQHQQSLYLGSRKTV